MNTESRIFLYPGQFSEAERTVLEFVSLRAHLFRYRSGVCAIRAENKNGQLIVLPYQGQQIWRLSFLEHDLTMKSMFDEPVPTQLFHANYGMFLLHCGLTAMGNPSPQDTHPQHGELPFAPFSDAWLSTGQDERGRYLCLGGSYRHTRAFRTDYRFEVFYKLYEDATTIEVTVRFTNLRPDDLEYFYMCHINFRPVDGARLSYSAYHKDIKPHYALSSRLSEEKKQAYNAFFEKLQSSPEIQDIVDRQTQMYEPEICSTIHYQHDATGSAYCMQVLPDGCACYVRFDPEKLPIGLRWIARTGPEDAMGMVLPATAEHLGYTYCKQHHFERYLPSGQSEQYQIEIGLLPPARAAETEEAIHRILSANTP